jgi:hypothetical protein
MALSDLSACNSPASSSQHQKTVLARTVFCRQLLCAGGIVEEAPRRVQRQAEAKIQTSGLVRACTHCDPSVTLDVHLVQHLRINSWYQFKSDRTYFTGRIRAAVTGIHCQFAWCRKQPSVQFTWPACLVANQTEYQVYHQLTMRVPSSSHPDIAVHTSFKGCPRLMPSWLLTAQPGKVF